MQRVARKVLEERHGISAQSRHPGENITEMWIGFAFDEDARVKIPADRQWRYFRYPLIEMGLTKADVDEFFSEFDLPLPVPSVCIACPYNNVAYFKELHDNYPDEWAKAVEIDESVRHNLPNVRQPLYVSSTLLPLAELARRGFDLTDAPKKECTSGHCFL
jgi:hypothetical protein